MTPRMHSFTAAVAMAAALGVTSARPAAPPAPVDAAVWPAPASGAIAAQQWATLAPDFKIALPPAVPPTSVLAGGAERYQVRIQAVIARGAAMSALQSGSSVEALDVRVSDAAAPTPFAFPMDEAYNLTLEAAEAGQRGGATVVLTATTQWGALRGFETVLQLAEAAILGGAPAGLPSPLAVADLPRFHWRGVMMDLSRHYYSVGFIKKTMDVMEGNKMNVLHLHITDDQSFPVESDAVPELAVAGVFHPSQKYTADDIEALVTYGTNRGIHVVPEFDMPAHTASWGAGRPDIMVQGEGCSPQPFEHGDVMNPTTPATFEVLDALLSEQSARFGGAFFHLGGDEVPTSCWLENATIKEWMAKQGYADTGQVESYFVNKVASGPKFSQHNQNLVYWQEIFQNNVSLRPSTVIQAWKTDVMPDVMKAGFRVTNSYGWYLNHGCDNYGDGNWDKFYENEPDELAPGVTPAERALLLGGEVTMWSECVDEVIFEAIVWLRASGAAEKMWSPKKATESASLDVASRLARHRCRLLHRNVTVEPINSGGSGSHAVNPQC
mmetsp:Transcript_7284/g.21522  ORF Transcript_7284/g.21522 Transcript_7284/m.21522 type:complete len:553 (+) Transcript_7284:73-1731(+)